MTSKGYQRLERKIERAEKREGHLTARASYIAHAAAGKAARERRTKRATPDFRGSTYVQPDGRTPKSGPTPGARRGPKPARNPDGTFRSKAPSRRRNPTGAGFMEGGVFHPVRASADYQPLRAHDLSTPVGRALKDWISGRAYVDNAGNYRLKDLVDPKGGLRRSNYKSGGRIAPWNKAAKKAFGGPADLHAEAVKESAYMPKRITDAHYSR